MGQQNYKKNNNENKMDFKEELKKKIRDFNPLEDYLKLHISPKQEGINTLKDFFKSNNRDISASQLRNLFDEIKKADTNMKNIVMMKVKLAYIASKTEKRKKGYHAYLLLLGELIDEAIKLDNNQKATKESPEKIFVDYKKGLVTFLEASIAYQKYYEKLKQNAY